MKTHRMRHCLLAVVAILLLPGIGGCPKRINSCPEAPVPTREAVHAIAEFSWGDKDIQNWIVIHSDNIDELVKEHPEYSRLTVPGAIYEKILDTYEPRPEVEYFLDKTLRTFEALDRRNEN